MGSSKLDTNSDPNKTAHIFPAFVPEYLGIETQVIERYGINFRAFLEKASEISGSKLSDFHITENTLLGDKLKSQYITYIISCCISDILHDRKQIPTFVSAYSMGIYAAMYHCGSIDFGTGLSMIKAAFETIEKNLPEPPSSMCSIGGLNRDDIEALIRPYQKDTFIINQNSEFSFLLSGNEKHLGQILKEAAEAGAIQARMLPVTHPYHAPLLKTASVEFHQALQNMLIGNNNLKYLSAVDMRIILNRDDIITELSNNLSVSFDWYKTFLFLLKNGVNTFIECGAGESLYRIGKFIEGNFTICNLKKLNNYVKY